MHIAEKTAIKLWQCFNEKKWKEARELLHDDFEAVWIQSRELIKGADHFIRLNRDYPGSQKIRVTNTHHYFDPQDRMDHVITEVHIQSISPEGHPYSLFAVSFFKIQDGIILGAREYWADTYAPPQWRSHLVESLY